MDYVSFREGISLNKKIWSLAKWFFSLRNGSILRLLTWASIPEITAAASESPPAEVTTRRPEAHWGQHLGGFQLLIPPGWLKLINCHKKIVSNMQLPLTRVIMSQSFQSQRAQQLLNVAVDCKKTESAHLKTSHCESLWHQKLIYTSNYSVQQLGWKILSSKCCAILRLSGWKSRNQNNKRSSL